jgi:hypothetical protein
MFHGQEPFFKKGVGDPNLFTVSQMAFFRGVISKACFFCMLLQDISKERPLATGGEGICCPIQKKKLKKMVLSIEILTLFL